MMKNYLILLVLFLSTIPGFSQEEKDYLKETQEDLDSRMEWWRDAGFGMFIHWGIYSVPAGVYNGEKPQYAVSILDQTNIPKEVYEKYSEEFNPVKFNAEDWVRMAREAGMKYIVITSKHHDGFCMWDSKVSDYDIMDRTPYKIDVLKELAEACKKEGVRFCIYYSIIDWHHPDAYEENFDKYREEYLKPQLKELVSNYGDIGVLWFDGEWISEWTEEQGKDLYNYLRNLMPDIIINNRVGKGRAAGTQGMNNYEDAAGDFGTPEQEILEGGSTLYWESCMTMNDHWGYTSYDENFKSTDMLIHNMLDIAAKGGNYLLNIGPTSEGLFPDESIKSLKEIGEWMDINGEIIHNSRSIKNYRETESLYYLTSKDKKFMYAVSTKWPGNTLNIKYVQPNTDSEVYLLGYDFPLEWTYVVEKGTVIQIPDELQNEENWPCKFAWVFKMQGKE